MKKKNANEPAATEPAAEAPVAVLLLVDSHYGKCGQVAEIPAAEVDQAKAGGLIDDHPDAVNSAKG